MCRGDFLGSSFFRYLGFVAPVLLVNLRTIDGASIIPGGHCKVYHLNGNEAGSSTPLVPLSKSMVVYLYSDSPFWSHFSLGFTNRFDETTGMLSYQKSAEEEEQDASGTFTLTGLQDAEDGDGSAKKYKEEVVKIPGDVFHLQHNVWITLTLGVVDNKLKLFFADYATIHFTLNAALFTKASVHSEQGQAISVTFNCMDSQNRTEATHSNSKTGLIIGLTILILAGLLITAYILRKRINGLLDIYILRKRRHRQQSSSSEEMPEQISENTKTSIQNDPLESQSDCETRRLLKPKGERDTEYRTENEVEFDEPISEVIKNDDEMATDLKCPKKADQTSKQTNENITLTDENLQEKEKSSQAYAPLVMSMNSHRGEITFQFGDAKPVLSVIPNAEDGKIILDKHSVLSSQGQDALQREPRGNQSGENSTPDESGAQKSYQEKALQQEVDANQGNKTISVQSKSKEMHNYSISDLLHTLVPDIVKRTTMQYNCSSNNASERATPGADNYLSEHQVRFGLTEKQQNGKEHTKEILNSTAPCQTAHSTYVETDSKSIAKLSSNEGQGNLLERRKSTAVGQEMEDFSAMVPDLPKSRENPKQESQENQAEKEQSQEKTDAESKSSTEITHYKDIQETNTSEILPLSTRSPSKEDTLNRQETTKRESAEKNKKNKKNKTKKTARKSNTPKTHSPENHPAEVASESTHLNKPIQDISLPVMENRDDRRQITHTPRKDSRKKQKPHKDAPQSAACGSVAPLQNGKPEENQKLYETPTTTASLQMTSKILVPTHVDPVSASINSKPEPPASKTNELNEEPQVNHQVNLLISDQAHLSQAAMQPQNIHILPINRACTQDTDCTKIHQSLENIQPRTEDNKIKEGLDTASNELTDSESGKCVINVSSHKVIQENLGTNESNGKQVQCNNNYSHDATNQQLPYAYSTSSMPTEEERHLTQIQKIPRDLIIPSNCKGANMERDTHPQVEHLPREIMKLEPPTELSKVEEFKLTNRNQTSIHTSSNCLHFHRHLYKILLQSLNTSGCQRDFEIKLSEELEFKLTKLNQSFPHKSSKWKNTHFHRDVRKKLVRKPPYRASGDILHAFTHMETKKSKKNRIRYLLYLKKCGCQVFVTSLRKKNIQNHHPMEVNEITEDNNSAMEVSEIANGMEYNGASCKGLPSSDEEML